MLSQKNRFARNAHAAGGLTLLVALLGGSSAFAQAAPRGTPVGDGPVNNGVKLQTAADMIQAQPQGLTADDVGKRAGETSYSAQAAHEQLRAAVARANAAWVNFLPRLSATASYTRLSNFTPPSLGSILTPTDQNAPAGVPYTGPIVPFPFTFPLILDNFLMQATISIPISDYFLRINQGYSAATHSESAARFDAAAAKAKAVSDGKVTYYTWLRARGSQRVAEQALDDQKTHLTDANNLFNAGRASKADVLRAETGVAQAELQVEQAQNLALLTETQVRVAMHEPTEAPLTPGESLDAQPPAVQGSVHELTQEALTSRLEVKSVDANASAATEQVSVQKAGYYPQIAGVGDAILANPNPRFIPATDKWFPTWDVGARLTWSPNDAIAASANGSDYEARAAAIVAQRGTVRDGITIEVTQAWNAVREADFAIDTSKREITSATEAYRVARELFNAGVGTSTTLTDAETELTRSRLDALNAAVNARVARVQLDHALGRDALVPTDR